MKLTRSDSLTIHKLTTAYLSDMEHKTSTDNLKDKRTIYKRLCKEIPPETPVERVGKAAMVQFLNKIKSEKGPARANRYRVHITACYNWGIEMELLQPPNPWQIRPYGEDKNVRYVPSEKDFWQVVKVAEPEQKRLLLTYLYTAARREEVFRLVRDDLDFQHHLIQLKTRKRRGGGLESDWIPMYSGLEDILREQLREKPFQTYIFEVPPGRSPEKYKRHMMPRLCKKAGVKPFGFHSIRHLSASILDGQGVPISVVQSILRHKNLTVTSGYLQSLRGVKADLEEVWGKRINLDTGESGW